jgi:arsenate reductase-like glutaredoxin family protein
VIQIFGTKKCRDTQKAIRFFKERSIQIHFVDLADKGISPGELRNISRSIPVAELIDREGKQFRKRNLQYMKFNIEDELLDDPLLFKTPIVRFKQKAAIGYRPDIWQEWAREIKS